MTANLKAIIKDTAESIVGQVEKCVFRSTSIKVTEKILSEMVVKFEADVVPAPPEVNPPLPP